MQNKRIKKINDSNNADLLPVAEKENRLVFLFLRILCFFTLLCFLGTYLFNVFDMKDDKGAEKVFRSFYREEENSLDGIYLGSSSAYRFWIPPYAFEKSGMTISNLGTGSQPVVLQKYIIAEALKTQPGMKVILIDIRSMLNDDKRLKEADIRRVTDAFPLMDPWYRPSGNRIHAINASLDYFASQNADIEYTKLYYYFPFLKYHNRWQSDIKLKELTGLKYSNHFKGFVFTSSGSMRVKKLKQPYYTDETANEIDPVKEEILDELINYCKRLDQEVIFVSSPYQISENEQKKLNSFRKIITKAGFIFLDYNTVENVNELELNWHTDFMDKKHVNVYGAMKYTEHLMKYLQEQLNLKDHRDDSTYNSWKQSAERFHEKLERLETQEEGENN